MQYCTESNEDRSATDTFARRFIPIFPNFSEFFRTFSNFSIFSDPPIPRIPQFPCFLLLNRFIRIYSDLFRFNPIFPNFSDFPIFCLQFCTESIETRSGSDAFCIGINSDLFRFIPNYSDFFRFFPNFSDFFRIFLHHMGLLLFAPDSNFSDFSDFFRIFPNFSFPVLAD